MRDFSKVERIFSELFAGTSCPLLAEEKNEVQDFVDHGEYGLALETLVDILVEKAMIPTDIVLSAVVTLANRMSMDPQPLLHRLRPS